MQKVKRIIVWIVAISVMLGIGSSFVGCDDLVAIIDEASNYTEEEHLQRVSALVEKRYMKEGSEYTSYEVHPVYDEYEDLSYFVVDFEPEGYVYIYLNKKIVSFGPSMYLRDPDESEFWRPYTYAPGAECTVPDENGELVTHHDVMYKQDEEGNYYGFRISHFKAVNIVDEKRFLFQIYDDAGSKRGYAPAVKRGDKYFNLVSWEEFEFYPKLRSEECVISGIFFVGKSDFDL